MLKNSIAVLLLLLSLRKKHTREYQRVAAE